MAASQCPKCGHLFEVRDGWGEPLPLAHCQSCDSYYPAQVHSCKWCGTELIPEKARKGGSDRLKWVAAGTFVFAVLLGFLARDPSPKAAAHPRASDPPKPTVAVPADTIARLAPTPPVDTVPPRDAADTAVAASGEVTAPAPSAPAVETPYAIPQSESPPVTVAAASTEAPVSATRKVSARERRPSSPWVSMIAREWVIVRSGAEHSAHIVASVGPNSRVQLGETRGSWRRIKSRGIAGWVDASDASFAAVRSSSHRPRRIAGR